MEASDEEFDTEEVRKLVKRLDELDPIPLPWKSDEEALKDFWDYCEERQREETYNSRYEKLRMKIRIKKSVFWKNYVVKYIYEKSVNRYLGR